jgi:hypothetical protein
VFWRAAHRPQSRLILPGGRVYTEYTFRDGIA